MARSRVELFEQIRRDWRAEGSSIRDLAGRHHVHRRTVRQAMASAVPPPRKAYPPRPRPAIDRYAGLIDGWLLADREVPRKQRHTARRVWQRLVAEHGAVLAEVTVSRYVARRRQTVRLSAASVKVLDGPQVVAAHERAMGKYAEILVLDHYLEVLRYKPGALPGATALAQAKAAGAFTSVHQRYWDAARRAHGDPAGTRALIEVLLAHRTLPAGALLTAMTRAIDSGVADYQAVLIDARRQAARQVAPVIPIGALARYDRPAPTLGAYDQLLTGGTR